MLCPVELRALVRCNRQCPRNRQFPSPFQRRTGKAPAGCRGRLGTCRAEPAKSPTLSLEAALGFRPLENDVPGISTGRPTRLRAGRRSLCDPVRRRRFRSGVKSGRRNYARAGRCGTINDRHAAGKYADSGEITGLIRADFAAVALRKTAQRRWRRRSGCRPRRASARGSA